MTTVNYRPRRDAQILVRHDPVLPRAAGCPVVASQLGGNYWVRVIDFALLYIMLALGLNIVVGYTGLLDMGFIAFYAVGAYLAALMASPHLLEVFPILTVWFPDGLHTSYLLIIPLAALVAAVCGIYWAHRR
jgi:branched-chain amino acid transport system permease protein